MDKVIVTAAGIAGIAGIYWFFFGRREELMEPSDRWTVLVQGGYKPNVLKIPRGKPVTLTLIRKDPNSCLEEIVFPDYKIKEYLPLNKEVTITLNPPHKMSRFSCGMGMFHGRIEVA